MSDTPQALLFVLIECEPGVSVKDFHDWYDEEHIPARLTVPGITSATRYKEKDGEKPSWLAIYDLATAKTLESPAYLELRGKASENERTLMPRLPTVQRRIYSLITQSVKPDLPPRALPGKFLLAVLWSVPEDLVAEFHKWYDEEHMTEISKVPGWLRGRRYKMTDGVDLIGKGPTIQGWDYLAIHDWEGGEYMDSPEFRSAIGTPWSTKVINGVNGVLLRQFELYKDFEKP